MKERKICKRLRRIFVIGILKTCCPLCYCLTSLTRHHLNLITVSSGKQSYCKVESSEKNLGWDSKGLALGSGFSAYCPPHLGQTTFSEIQFPRVQNKKNQIVLQGCREEQMFLKNPFPPLFKNVRLIKRTVKKFLKGGGRIDP